MHDPSKAIPLHYTPIKSFDKVDSHAGNFCTGERESESNSSGEKSSGEKSSGEKSSGEHSEGKPASDNR